MRTLTPCFLAALLSTTALTTTRHADACGGYEAFRAAPQVMVVSSVGVYPATASDTVHESLRVFAITNANLQLPPDQAWERISLNSYDSTEMISLDKLARPRTITLVGPSGARVVRSDRRVALHQALFVAGSTFDAIEVPAGTKDDVEIALAGLHRDAVWHAMRPTYSRTSDIAGTDVKATSSQVDGKQMVELHASSGSYGTFEGYAVGAVDVGGARYVVISPTRGSAFTVEVVKT
jgi:hypothetical protein